jgi:glycine cleavage system T protein (aminomethyltransferase)
MAAPERHSHLLDVHRRLGAKLTDFAGWEMPLQYEGVIAEHNAVRNNVGVFDVSHLGKLSLSGPGSGDALQHSMTADVLALDPGRATYSLVLAEDAGCIDDVFVYRIDAEDWMVVPNAANVHAVTQAIRDSGGDPHDDWDRWAILAIQGPESFELFDKTFPESGALDLELHSFCKIDVFGRDGMVARTGYTGERGFELYAPAETARDAWQTLLDLGARPAGLGARDTLRLEMGYALYGHELTREVNPLEARLGWIVAWDTDFRGKDALLRVKETGPAKRLFGIRCTERGVPRQGYEVWAAGDRRVGEVCSGNYSPSLRTGIALAFAPADAVPGEGDVVAIEARGRRIEGDIVKPPFYRH